MTEHLPYIAGAFVAGWWMRAFVDRQVGKLLVRIIASAIGKRKALELLAEGIAKMEARP